MGPEELLRSLREIHIPETVPLWPPAPGWWLLALLIIGALFGGIVLFHRRWALRRAALKELRRLAREHRADEDGLQLVKGVSALLRRVALARAPRDEVAGLVGPQWLEWLDRNGGDGFRRGAGRVLETAPYAPDPEIDTDALLTLARRWIVNNA